MPYEFRCSCLMWRSWSLLLCGNHFFSNTCRVVNKGGSPCSMLSGLQDVIIPVGFAARKAIETFAVFFKVWSGSPSWLEVCWLAATLSLVKSSTYLFSFNSDLFSSVWLWVGQRACVVIACCCWSLDVLLNTSQYMMRNFLSDKFNSYLIGVLWGHF